MKCSIPRIAYTHALLLCLTDIAAPGIRKQNETKTTFKSPASSSFMLHDGALNVGKAIQQTMHKLTFKGCGLLISFQKNKNYIFVYAFTRRPTNGSNNMGCQSSSHQQVHFFFSLVIQLVCVWRSSTASEAFKLWPEHAIKNKTTT